MIRNLKTDMTQEEGDFQAKMAEMHKKISMQENQLVANETEITREMQLKEKLQKELNANQVAKSDPYSDVTNQVTKRNLIK